MATVPNWYIEQGTGGYFLRIDTGTGHHDSEGLGDGITSLFVIVDALYDSQPGDLIAIDEPELSLHPTLQHRLAALLFDFAKDRQIVIATHSPYFVAPDLLANGMRICRATTSLGGTKLYQLSESVGKQISKLTADLNNPHAMGLKAREAFFQEDGVLLLEGQEDVQLLQRVQDSVGANIGLSPFGWGVGGADKMPLIAQMFLELGYERLIGILDANKNHVADGLRAKFPHYWFGVLAADDIRTKSARELPEVVGLLDANYDIRPEFFVATKRLFAEATSYLTQ